MRDNFSTVIRWFITATIFAFYIAFVFFSFSGNYTFLFTFDYWFTTVSTTTVAIFLRWMYSDRGVEKELEANVKIKAKEKEKSKLVSEIINSNLVGELDVAINNANKVNKLKAYRTKCDKKINHLRSKSWYKFNRVSRLKKWKDLKDETYSDEFNLDTIKITYYRYDIDEMLSSFYKEPTGERNKRRSKNGRVIGSMRANALTLLVIATLKGAEILYSEFTKEDIIVLIGQLATFLLNIYNGYNLGRSFIKQDYSSNLSEDFTFLKDFTKRNTIKSESPVVGATVTIEN